MRFEALCRMESRPGFSLGASVSPVAFTATAGGALEMRLGPFAAKVGKVPVRMAIPFLKRRRPLVVVASLGPARLRLEQFEVKVDAARFDLDGVLGTKGLEAKMEGKVDCRTEMQVAGTVRGRLGLSHVDLGDEDVGEVEQAT